jgi:putative redox protein
VQAFPFFPLLMLSFPMVSIDVAYDGDLHCDATHGPSSATLSTDAPTDNHGRGASFSPTDLVATGLATCILTIIGIQARMLDADVSGMTASVEKHMTESGPRRIDRLVTTVRIPHTYDGDTTRRLEAAGRGCPVHRSLRAEIDAPIRFEWG